MKTVQLITVLSVCLFAVPCLADCPTADIAGDDCMVNFKDLAVLANQWLESGTGRIAYIAIPPEAFTPSNSGMDYSNGGAMGGAYLVSGSGPMGAPVNLPQGATITNFKAFFYKDPASTCYITVSLDRFYMGFGGYGALVNLDNSGISNYGSKNSDCSEAVDNSSGVAYVIRVYSNLWDGSRARVNGVMIAYQY